MIWCCRLVNQCSSFVIHSNNIVNLISFTITTIFSSNVLHSLTYFLSTPILLQDICKDKQLLMLVIVLNVSLSLMFYQLLSPSPSTWKAHQSAFPTAAVLGNTMYGEKDHKFIRISNSFFPCDYKSKPWKHDVSQLFIKHLSCSFKLSFTKLNFSCFWIWCKRSLAPLFCFGRCPIHGWTNDKTQTSIYPLSPWTYSNG